MYIIDKEKNTVTKLKKCSFSELGFKERENLQEWIAKNPDMFDEDLLIIQKEFSDFSDTNERLDLLALDKNGDLVIIENKLDDTGRDVTWQALKYTSYCSGLSKDNVVRIFQKYLDQYDPGQKAEEIISEFFDTEFEDIQVNEGLAQRIFLVAAKFRKEVTSTVLWLLNYKLRIQCFKVTPYSENGQLFLTMNQIIPTKDAEEYMIKMADKTQDDIDTKTELKNRHVVRIDFWTKVIQEMNTKSNLFQNISPSKYNWISAGSGVAGIGFNFAASKTYGRAEVYIDKGKKEENEKVFDELKKLKDEIEAEFGGKLIWERLDDKRACRIKAELNSNVFIKENWSDMIKFMVTSMVNLEKSMKSRISAISLKSKNKKSSIIA